MSKKNWKELQKGNFLLREKKKKKKPTNRAKEKHLPSRLSFRYQFLPLNYNTLYHLLRTQYELTPNDLTGYLQFLSFSIN